MYIQIWVRLSLVCDFTLDIDNKGFWRNWVLKGVNVLLTVSYQLQSNSDHTKCECCQLHHRLTPSGYAYIYNFHLLKHDNDKISE